VSASVNCRPVLAAAGIETMMDVVVDGLVAAREQLPGKPAPDTYLGWRPAGPVISAGWSGWTGAGRLPRCGRREPMSW
jgi:hypothetical protein